MASQQLQNIGLALQGFGAGIGGQLPQFTQGLQNQQVLAQQQAEQKQKMAIERQKTYFTDADAMLKLLDAGHDEAVVRLGINRLQLLKQFPDANPEDSQVLAQLAVATRNGDEQARELLRSELEATVQLGIAEGILEAPKAEIIPQSAVSPTGQVAMRNPDGSISMQTIPGFQAPAQQQPEAIRALEARAQAAGYAPGSAEYRQFMAQGGPPPAATTDVGKLFQDMRNGLIPADIFQAQVSQLGKDPTETYIQQLEIERAELQNQQARQTLAQNEATAETKAAAADEMTALQLSEMERAYQIADSLLSSESLGAATGPISSRMPTFRSGTADVEADVAELTNLLTLGNLGRMTGVLSETDIKILASAASGLSLGASEERTIAKLREIKGRLEEAFRRKGGSAPLTTQMLSTMTAEQLIQALGGQ